jgi:arylsulfatase A-like enzyme
MRLPDRIQEGKVAGQLVSSVDIVPTVLDILGLPGEHEFDGQSIYHYIRGEGDRVRDFIYFETLAGYQKKEYLYGVKGQDWKLIMGLPDSTFELFSIGKDPQEISNLADIDKAIADSLSTVLHAFLQSGMELEDTGSFEVDPDLADELKALGYIQ